MHGAYFLLLMHYWRKGPLPNDPELLANIAKMTPDAWSIAQAVLMQFFYVGEDGLLHQKRADREIEAAIAKRKSAKEKARKGAAAKWGNRCSNDAPSSASSIPQALLEQCPLPLPLPILKATTTPSPSLPVSTPAPRKRRTKAAIIAGYTEGTRKVLESILEGWPTKQTDNSLIHIDRADLASKIDALLLQPEIEPNTLISAANAYLCENPYRLKAPQWFFGEGRGDGAHWLKYARAAELFNV
jgi:uncharacterized protein YdaU (DUF1376 family)